MRSRSLHASFCAGERVSMQHRLTVLHSTPAVEVKSFVQSPPKLLHTDARALTHHQKTKTPDFL
ncbi:hypothetical protein F9B82_10885 [Lacticaseibacillus casei]|nr:hypothetical protein F9B82_10885 [Lacticaseibacillus casei]